MSAGLSGKAAIVTGARRGIGRQVAVELARRGAGLVVTAQGDATEAVAEIRALGTDVVLVQGDLTDPAVRASAVDAAVSKFGRIDVLVNNAAYTDGPGVKQSLDELSLSEWRRQFEVNVHVPLALIQAAAPHLRAAGGGVIVNMTSPSARPRPVHRGQAPSPFGTLFGYEATKATIDRMTNSLAAALEPDGIAVIAFDPGLVLTENSIVAIEGAGLDPGIAGSPLETARQMLAVIEAGMAHTGEVIIGPQVAA
ncbi:MAG: SDR family NAD(P)-dependent oxidoreductase [Acidobacteria bacterium]|nr:SDR family NAD(P)-dependent oxidoreductase [Acidobacteriota bacterium]